MYGQELMDRVEAGDREAIGELIAENVGFLWFLADSVIKSGRPGDRDELMTLALETAFMASLKYRPDQGAWTTLVAKCFFHAYSQQHQRPRPTNATNINFDLMTGEYPDPVDEAIRNEEAAIVIKAINALTPLQAETIRKYYGIQGERESTLTEIAVANGRRTQTVHSAVAASRKHLRKRLIGAFV